MLTGIKANYQVKSEENFPSHHCSFQMSRKTFGHQKIRKNYCFNDIINKTEDCKCHYRLESNPEIVKSPFNFKNINSEEKCISLELEYE